MLYYLGTQERVAKYRGVEQMVARRAHNPEVAGSSPVPATSKSSLKRQVSASFFLQYGKSGNVPVTLTSKRQSDCARTIELFNHPGAFCG